jgi:hypothetical protein
MEVGLLDDTIEIRSDFTSKLFDFGDAMQFKQINEMTGQVFASDGATFVLDVLSEDGVVSSTTVDTGTLDESGEGALGITSLGEVPLTGSEQQDTLKSYIFRFPVYLSQRFVQFRFKEVSAGHVLIPYKMKINAFELEFNFFPTSNYV